jgi:hypothetical protein
MLLCFYASMLLCFYASMLYVYASMLYVYASMLLCPMSMQLSLWGKGATLGNLYEPDTSKKLGTNKKD